MYKKHRSLFEWGYMINGSENETGNEKIDHIEMT